MRSRARVFIALCLLPALAFGQNAPTDSNQQQSYGDAAAEQAPAKQIAQPVKHSPEGYPILEDGTPIRLRLSRTLSSADCRVGDRVDFKVVDPIVLDGITVVPQDSIAWGRISDAEHKKRLGRGGKLEVEIDSVRLANANKAKLRAVREAQGGGHQALMGGAMIGTAIVFLPAAPLFLLMHGKDVRIAEGTEITAYVDGDVVYATNASVYAPGAAPSAPAPSEVTPPPAQAVPPPSSAAPPPSATESTPAEAGSAEASAPPVDVSMEAVPAEAAPVSTEMTFTSTPAGAEIVLDGSYVGNTPSTIGVPGGEHTVRMSKHGYAPYERKLETSGGSVTVHADLGAATQ